MDIIVVMRVKEMKEDEESQKANCIILNDLNNNKNGHPSKARTEQTIQSPIISVADDRVMDLNEVLNNTNEKAIEPKAIQSKSTPVYFDEKYHIEETDTESMYFNSELDAESLKCKNIDIVKEDKITIMKEEQSDETNTAEVNYGDILQDVQDGIDTCLKYSVNNIKQEQNDYMETCELDLNRVIQDLCAQNDSLIGIEITQNSESHLQNSNKHFEDVNMMPVTNLEARPFQCQECGKCFCKDIHLKSHIGIHSKDKPFSCKICGKGFRQSSYLAAHKRTHRDTKPFECKHCGKCFRRAYHLRVHILIHSDERPYECTYCDKRFRQLGALHTHLDTHPGEKVQRPFKCTLCDKQFCQLGNLNTHFESHIGQNDKLVEIYLKCQECDKLFTRNNALTRHKKTHTSEKPFQCQLCDKSYKRKDDCAKHQRTHSGQLPYECKCCGKCFRYSGNYHSHMKSKCVSRTEDSLEVGDFMKVLYRPSCHGDGCT